MAAAGEQVPASLWLQGMCRCSRVALRLPKSRDAGEVELTDFFKQENQTENYGSCPS